MPRTRFKPHEESVVLAAGVQKEVTVKGPAEPNLVAVVYHSFSHDEAKLNGGNIQDLQVQIVPREQTDLYGGSVFHSPYAAPSRNTSNRNALSLGDMELRPGEDLVLTLLSAAGQTFRIRLERTFIYTDPK